jgi:hypothetical protein
MAAVAAVAAVIRSARSRESASGGRPRASRWPETGPDAGPDAGPGTGPDADPPPTPLAGPVPVRRFNKRHPTSGLSRQTLAPDLVGLRVDFPFI